LIRHGCSCGLRVGGFGSVRLPTSISERSSSPFQLWLAEEPKLDNKAQQRTRGPRLNRQQGTDLAGRQQPKGNRRLAEQLAILGLVPKHMLDIRYGEHSRAYRDLTDARAMEIVRFQDRDEVRGPEPTLTNEVEQKEHRILPVFVSVPNRVSTKTGPTAFQRGANRRSAQFLPSLTSAVRGRNTASCNAFATAVSCALARGVVMR
jgi:hypothetical protein